MITPDAPDRSYSTRLRTALLFTGSGTAGAYHAGVLRALHEAGVKIDLVGGRGIGAASALFAAIDGGARLWEAGGVWKTPGSRRFYGWRRPLRVAGYAALTAALVLLLPLSLMVAAVLTGLAGLLLTLVGLERRRAGSTLTFTQWIDVLFAPAALPTVVPRLVLFALLAAVAILVGSRRRGTRARSAAAAVAARRDLASSGRAALDRPLVERCATDLWNLIRGAAPIAVPSRRDLGRKYVELLAENLGQPGFRDCCVVAHDLDARRDLVFAQLSQAQRSRFFARVGTDPSARLLETFDLGGCGERSRARRADGGGGGAARHRAAPASGSSSEGPWRGETHRLCDRPDALTRLIEEAAYAGAEQVILVSAAPPGGRAHELRAGPRGPAGPRRRAPGGVRNRVVARRARAVHRPLRVAVRRSGPRTIR